MARDRSSLSRREALQQIGIIGIGTVVSACGNGNGGSEATASPTASLTPTAQSTSIPPPTSTPTLVPSALPTGTPQPPPPSASPTLSSSPTATGTPVQVSCFLTPEQILGPFFIDVGLARSDIREDRAGVLLRLALQLVEADGCTPIRDAVVNVWHSDAAGLYSGFAGQPGGIDTTGETFLRGFQMTDADGRVEFTTIYPGWYPGRTPHIHVRIHLDSTTVLVSQVYFDDSVTDAVYAQPPYNSRPARDTTNATDGIAGADLNDLLLDLEAADGGYVGSIVLGVAPL